MVFELSARESSGSVGSDERAGDVHGGLAGFEGAGREREVGAGGVPGAAHVVHGHVAQGERVGRVPLRP